MNIIIFIFRLMCASWLPPLRASMSELGWALGFKLGFSVCVVLGAPVGYPFGYSINMFLGLALDNYFGIW